MSINTKRNRKTSANPNGFSLDNERLDSRNQLSLTTWLKSKIAEALDPEGMTLAEATLPTLSVATALALASRGIKPAHLKDTFLGSLIDDFVDLLQPGDLRIDNTDFGKTLTAIANPALVESHRRSRDRLLNTLADKSLASPLRQIASDPLLVGWVYQSILMGKNDYSFLRNEKSLTGLAQITQWFTPDWIANFLVEECFQHPVAAKYSKTGDEALPALPEAARGVAPIKIACTEEARGAQHSAVAGINRAALSSITFLDSSCGAGQILIPALDRLVQRRRQFGQSAVDAISDVLSNDLFGLDIDPLMAQLAGLSIYLRCRDFDAEASFPIPNIFHFPTHKTDAFAGSLLLSIEDAHLQGLDGSLLHAQKLPLQFDLQACNPPYLSHRLMPKELAQFLKKNYSNSHYDLYTAFLELGIRLMAPGGKLSLICQQSFLSTNRFEPLRRKLIERARVDTIVRLGPGAFSSRQGEKVNNAIITLSRRHDAGQDLLESQEAHHHRLSAYKIMSRAAKHTAERDGLTGYIVKTLAEDDFLQLTNSIPGFPLAPFCPKEIAALFQTYPSINDSESGITITNGLFTCDNKRFVRHFQNIDDNERTNFVPYDKGGGQKWYSTTPYVLEWRNNGENIRSFRFDRGQSRALPGERFYFKKGITYSYIGTKGFKARLLSPGSVFDIASSAIFSEEISLSYLLGFFNSALVRFILGFLNPTVNFQIGDLRRLPFIKPPSQVEAGVVGLVNEAVELARSIDRLNTNSPIYDPQSILTIVSADNSATTTDGISSHVAAINQKESHIQGAIDEFVFDLYQIAPETRLTICADEWVTANSGDLFSAAQLARYLRSVDERTI
ncbi:MAG: N-6 DNA methylase [Candidatus Obscuribacterales bacterium]|nr:N-6 DNA methylase [Candidatus Obscuribacterales bacterium]